jgi:ribose transport system substrate-binding protein
MAALEEGTIQALIAQMPGDIGVQGVQQAVAALEGDETTPEIETGFTIITKDNVDGEGGDAAYKSSC